MVNPPSQFLTPPEPVAWDSSQSAIPPSRIDRRSEFLLSAIYPAITLGWLRRRAGKTSFLLFFNLILCTIFIEIVRAEDSALTTPTRLLIPTITVDSVIVPVGWKKVELDGQTYAQWEVDDNRVGWHDLSAPLGQVGNSVLNGHSNLYAQVFRNLDQVKIGDFIVVFSGDQIYYYEVAQTILVQEKGVSLEKRIENAKLILPTTDERLTLITCTGPGATHRLIVIAYPSHSHRQ